MDRAVKPRPAIFRALGKAEPPQNLMIDGEKYDRAEVYKHDSWAATARYSGEKRDVVCKLNRTQSVFGFPMKWLGRFLAKRESFAYSELSDISGITPGCQQIESDGKSLSNATAHEFVAGHPLQSNEVVDDAFFPLLINILRAVHERGFAYVDLHKRENILVGEDGRPYLIDFQINFSKKTLFWPLNGPLLRMLQASDLYHVTKHVLRLRPDQVELLGLTSYAQKPWWIRAHRKVAVPFRQFRRGLLTKLGIRGKSGRSASETFAEHAFRCENESKKAA